MSRSSLVARRSMLAIAATAVVAAGLLFAPVASFAAAASSLPATKGFTVFAKSAGAAKADAVRFLQTLATDGALSDWRGATVSQSLPVQGPDGSVAVYVVTLTTGGDYAGYVTIDALPSANPVLEFSRNPAPVFASDTVAQTRVGVAKSAPRVKRQVYLGPLAYAVETVAATGATDTVPVGALMHETSTGAIRGPPAVGAVGSVGAAGSVTASPLGTNYKMIAGMPDYDQFPYNYTSSEYNSGTTPAATGGYASSPYLNAGSYYSGCAPTAAGDVVGYWAANGYPRLSTGRSPAQGGPAWEKLVNDLHVYFRCFDSGGGGSTYGSAVAPGLKNYAQGIGGYSFGSVDVAGFSWAAYTGEIDANRPVVLMFQNLNVTAPKAFAYGDHAITGIGYDHTPGTVSSEYMIVHDNWPAYTSDDVYVQFSGPNTTYDSRDMVTFVPAAAAPPANDAFASSQALSGASGSVTGTSVSASKQAGEPDHAGNTGGASIWYSWTASSAGTLTVDTLGSAYNTLLAAYTGTSVSALTPVASNDDFASGQQSRIAFPVTPGTTYRIAVDGSAGASGLVSLNWAFVAPDKVSATIDTATSGPVLQGAPVAFAGHATDSLGHAISSYEWMSSLDGTISSSASFSTTALSAGTHTIGFRARCANGAWSAQKTVTLQVTSPSVTLAAPANDAFSAARTLSASSGTTSGTSVSATKETGEPNHAGNAGGASIWYRWVAPATGSLSIDTSGSGFDTVLAVYTGTSVGALVGKTSDDDIAAGNTASRVTLSVVAGTAYRIAVDGYDGASGSVTLTWAFRARIASSSTVRLSASRLTRYHYITISGTLKPARAKAAVRIEILKPGSHTWICLVTRTTNSAGAWASYRYKVRLRGIYHVRIRFLGDTKYAPSTSSYAHLTVR